MSETKITWEELQQKMDENEILSVKISSVVKGGVIANVEGKRGFIPASQLSKDYVENLDEWMNKTIDVKIITVEPEQKRLVLSGRAVEVQKDAEAKAAQIEAINVGDVFTGTVQKLTNYGAFVALENGLSGLVHISQISPKRINTPAEALEVGQTTPVKVINKKDGKLSLSIKAATAPARPEKAPSFSFKSEGNASTSLGSLLAGIKLD